MFYLFKKFIMTKKTKKVMIEIIKVVVYAILGYFGIPLAQ